MSFLYIRNDISGKIYCVDATNGNDAYPGTMAQPWQTIAKVNGITFDFGDQILFKCGEAWREQLNIHGTGVIIGNYGSGVKPVISGADAITSWTDDGGNIWHAAVAVEPGWVLFVAGDGTITWGDKKAAVVNLVNEYDYCWVTGVVSVYSPSNPGTHYAFVEGTQRNYSIRDYTSGTTDYITINGIECKFAKVAGIRQTVYDTGWVIINNTCHHHGSPDQANGHGAYLMGTDITVRGNVFYQNGQHGLFVYSNAGAAIGNILIEQNEAYDNWHTNYDIESYLYPVTNVTVRRNKSYFTDANIPTGTESFFFQGLDNTTRYIDGLEVYNNIALSTKGIGFYLDSYIRNARLLHNTVYSGSDEAFYVNDDITNATMVFKNNILVTVGTAAAFYLDSSTNKTIDNNCYLTVSGKYANINATLYTVWATYQGAGFEANGVNADPLVVSSSDMHLQSGSPCIGEGDVSVGILTDYADVTRGAAVDIGAYEYVA